MMSTHSSLRSSGSQRSEEHEHVAGMSLQPPALCLCSASSLDLRPEELQAGNPSLRLRASDSSLLPGVVPLDFVLLTPAYIYHLILLSFLFQQVYIHFDFTISLF